MFAGDTHNVMRIETDRLILREFKNKHQDINDLIDNLNHEEIGNFLSDVPYPYTATDARKFIGECIKDSKKIPRENYEIGIELKETKKIIGCLELAIDEHEQDRSAGFSFWQGYEYCGKGYMVEAVRTWLEFAFNDLGLRRVEAAVAAGNLKSQKMLELKIGMRKEGISIQNFVSIASGNTHDSITYGLLKHEYEFIKNHRFEQNAAMYKK